MNEAQKAVLPIIESVYTDGVDAIGEPSLSGDERFIIVQFQDGEKLLEAKISDTDIEIKMLNPEDEENRNLEDERQKKKCTTGKPCGNTCIAKHKECKAGKDRSAEVQDFLGKAKYFAANAKSLDQAELSGYNRRAWRIVAEKMESGAVTFLDDDAGQTIGAVVTKTNTSGQLEIEALAWRPTGDSKEAVDRATQLAEFIKESEPNIKGKITIKELASIYDEVEIDYDVNPFRRPSESPRADFKHLINEGKEALKKVFDGESVLKVEKSIEKLRDEASVLTKEIRKTKGEEKKLLKEKEKQLIADIDKLSVLVDSEFSKALNFLKKDADSGKIKELVDSLNFEGLFTDAVSDYKKYAGEVLALIGQNRLPARLHTFKITESGRAYAELATRTIAMNNYSNDSISSWAKEKNKVTLFHEMGHFVEYDDRALIIATKDWIKSRATGNPEKLSKLANNSGYGTDEEAYPDKFADPYVGKIYTFDASEVISMGVQYLSSPSEARKFFAKDPEHFHLTVGTLITGRKNQ